MNAMSKQRIVTRSARWALLAALAANAWAAPGWTDRKEYDLALKIRVEASPQKQLEMLKQWTQQYPKSEMRQMRRELFLAAYQASGDNASMFGVAGEMTAEQPDNLVGVYWCTLLTPEMKDAKPETLAAGEKAAQQLLAKLDVYFAANQKPKEMPDADWRNQKAAAELLANRTTGWVEWQRGNFPAAEKTFTAYLQKDPKSAEITSWLGYVLAAEDRLVPAAWQLSRAASLKGDGALAEAWRRQVDELSERLYANYHGALDGVEKLKAGAIAAAFPPADFQVESAEVIRQRRAEEQLNQADPELGAWLRISRQLNGPDGDKYFTDTLKPAPLPKLRGTIVRCNPATKPNEIVLGVSSATAEEVTLRVSTPFPYAADPGTVIEFQGTADAFVKTPFSLTVLADPANVSGWPDPPGKKK